MMRYGKLERYDIMSVLYEDSFGTVYLAKHKILQCNVALKIFYKYVSDMESRENFIINARIVANFQHPSIIDIFDAGLTHENVFFVVYEYLEGGSLSDFLKTKDIQLSPEQIVDILINIIDAIDYIHRRGYIHLTLKTRDILQDSNGLPKLFSFESVVQENNLEVAKLSLFPFYAAPERFVGKPDEIGPHTDIWGLGVILFEMLTGGYRPFTGNSIQEIIDSINTISPTSPSALNPSIPPELDKICLKCLSKKPQNRYSSANLLLADLEKWRQSGSITEENRVFVSHSSQDRKFVEREIISKLEKNGIKTWYSKVDIQTASEWHQSIIHGLESCNWFILVMSPRSSNSEWVKDEVHWAIDKRPSRVIPILMEDCNFNDFHIRLARIQYIDFRKPTEELTIKLIKTLKDNAP